MFPLLLALPDLIAAAGKILGLIDHPSAKTAVDALTGVTSAIQSKDITPAQMSQASADQLADANAHMEAMAQTFAQADSDEQQQNQETARAELLSSDGFVRRARPFFTYMIAISWFVQMNGVTALFFWNAPLALQILTGLSQLTPLWGIALGIVGVYHYGRTQEKRAAMTGDADSIQTVAKAGGDLWAAVTKKVAN